MDDFEAIIWEKSHNASSSYSNNITSILLSHFLKLYTLTKIVQIIFKCKTTHNTPASSTWAAAQCSHRPPFSRSKAKIWAPSSTGFPTIASRRKNGRSGSNSKRTHHSQLKGRVKPSRASIIWSISSSVRNCRKWATPRMSPKKHCSSQVSI